MRAAMAFAATEAAPLYTYRGVVVTADHAVRLDSGEWCRAADAPGAERARNGGADESTVFDLITARHRLKLAGPHGGECTTFADYEETEDTEHDLRSFLRALERDDRRQGMRHQVLSVVR